MQLNCPNCAEKLRAENINIQELVAVCPNCDTVFKFTPQDESTKAKRRKIKQPQAMILRDDEALQMRFRTNFHLARNENFVGASVMSLAFSFIAVLLINEAATGEVPLLFPIGFSLFVLGLLYWLALTVYNSTEIIMDDESIKVSRKPLPVLLNQAQEINLHGVSAITCEETPKSIKEGYDTPRYNVWAILGDGNRKLIVADMIYDYGFFIAQRLEERLHLEGELDASRLEDNVQDSMGELDTETVLKNSQGNR